MDRAKLVKVLALTTSDVDGEALAALRAANKMLAADNMTWADLLTERPRHVTVSMTREPYKAEEAWVPPHLKDKVMIELMFRAVFAQPRSDNEEFWQFMDSIHNRWRKHANLSQGQYSALKRCYSRVKAS